MWRTVKQLTTSCVLGINKRNAGYTLRYNPRRLYKQLAVFNKMKQVLILLIVLSVATGIAWLVYERIDEVADRQRSRGGKKPVPVEVAEIQRGPIELVHIFTGTLEAQAQFVVAPKVSGLIEELSVDMADTVIRGQVVAKLDDAEYVQAVIQAQADLAVAKANLAEAESLMTISQRKLERIEKLYQRGINSGEQFDTAKAEQLSAQARIKVTQAQLKRAEAVLKTARIRLTYTKVTANWVGGSRQRVVAERYLDEGETVSANAPLLQIVELNPIMAVFFVTERDYASLKLGQVAFLVTDAYSGEKFHGKIERIAPMFDKGTRQARVELRVNNSDLRLKPGMFARVSVALEQVAETTIVPEHALTKRNQQNGIFVLNGESVVWREVQVGIRQGERVQVTGEDLTGLVVTLGQQLLDNGSTVIYRKSQ